MAKKHGDVRIEHPQGKCIWNHSNKTAQNAVLQTFCHRALDKRESLMIFFLYSSKPYVVTPHLNRFVKTVQMRGNNICFMQN